MNTMRRLAFFAPLAATLAVAAMAQAQAATVNVTVGPQLQRQVEKLGDREVNDQIAGLQAEVGKALAQRYPGATANLVLVDLKPNRPTFEQVRQTPGLDPINSISIGGATIKGQIITADGQTRPVDYSYFSPSINDVWGYSVWRDADRAFERLGDRIEQGRF
jgi:opacity protein-like surface antigen